MSIVKSIEKSKDGTIKFHYDEGYNAVLIPHYNGKNTLCVSSQLGCAMDCQFCLTAKLKFKKNLDSKQIVEQFEEALFYISKKENIQSKLNKKAKYHSKELITSIVFMGMGEPLNNTENVITACNYLNKTYFYPYKKITISTSGIIPEMNKLIDMKQKIPLALSLHSPFQDIRNKIMPGLKLFDIKDLVKVCNKYNLKNRQKIMIEYLMIGGLTDRDEDIEELITLGLDKMTNFNLIPLNSPMLLYGKEYLSSDLKRCEFFKRKLIAAGFKCFIRENMGNDIEAACGMLSGNLSTLNKDKTLKKNSLN
ncbi:MAG: radical SAM protein [Nanoarchaeota archaeon]|nr:radical SAM protein [Nanoarchaeota archaeon]